MRALECRGAVAFHGCLGVACLRESGLRGSGGHVRAGMSGVGGLLKGSALPGCGRLAQTLACWYVKGDSCYGELDGGWR